MVNIFWFRCWNAAPSLERTRKIRLPTWRPTQLKDGADSRSSARCANVATAAQTNRTKHSNSRWISHQCRYHVVVLQGGRAPHTPNWTIFPNLKKPLAQPNLGRSSEPRPVQFATSEKRLSASTTAPRLPCFLPLKLGRLAVKVLMLVRGCDGGGDSPTIPRSQGANFQMMAVACGNMPWSSQQCAPVR